ncbi:MAG: zinc ribbon domain-containing protein [Gammaproteobacteria bacterium]|jgi:putative FmdB family regulatory protein|nr:zinc ribbon domain-containing protein [Gammaproteobacteria bacterium]MDX2458855.1 zinc ribbon domain-containing protein [Gammaproteobacteria bacterium]
MPIYEYECGACGERREFIQKFSDAPKRKCPACGASKLKRLVSAAAFHLKGTGWYVTDFRDKNKKKDGDKEATSSSKDSDTSSKETTTTKTAEKTTKSSDSTTKSGDKKSAG